MQTPKVVNEIYQPRVSGGRERDQSPCLEGIAAGPHAWANRHVLARRPMVWVGLVSYPLYLWHWPLLSFAQIVESGLPSSKIRGGAATPQVFTQATQLTIPGSGTAGVANPYPSTINVSAPASSVVTVFDDERVS